MSAEQWQQVALGKKQIGYELVEGTSYFAIINQ